MIDMTELKVNICDALSCLSNIIMNLEKQTYQVIISSENDKDANGNNAVKLYYDVVKTSNPSSIEASVVVMLTEVDKMRENRSIGELAKSIGITIHDLKEALLDSVYDYPIIIKFCELLDEIDYMGVDDITMEYWEEIFNIVVDYGMIEKELNDQSCFHFEKCKKIVLS